jgi:ATP-dependent RNA helicase RhlE
MTFNELSIIEPILKALEIEGYKTPTQIQSEAIPVILQGRDIFGSAQTGTGKTAAFAIPVLQILSKGEKKGHKRPLRSLVLTPTRELAIQVGESFEAYGKNLDLKYAVIYGGVNQKSQTDALRAGVDIVVATPGRLLDLINQKFVNLSQIELFILDEADRMLDMGFIHDIKKIIKLLPEEKQSLFFSATAPAEIQKLAGSILVDPVSVAVTPKATAAETVRQSVYFVSKVRKRELLNYLLQCEIMEPVIVFTRTKHGADRVAKDLVRKGVKAEAIHGDKSQNARQRALTNFKNKDIAVLVATDIAARGIDIDKLPYVINYDLPNEPETYVHRIGRTGRAGESGIAYSFCDSEEMVYLQDIQKLIGLKITVVEDHPFIPTREELVAEALQKAESDKSKKKFAANAGNNKNNGGGGNKKKKFVGANVKKKKSLAGPAK